MKTKKYIVRVFQGVDRQWYWTLKSSNGQALGTSEGYSRKASAQRTIGNIINHLNPANVKWEK